MNTFIFYCVRKNKLTFSECQHVLHYTIFSEEYIHACITSAYDFATSSREGIFAIL